MKLIISNSANKFYDPIVNCKIEKIGYGLYYIIFELSYKGESKSVKLAINDSQFFDQVQELESNGERSELILDKYIDQFNDDIIQFCEDQETTVSK